jgi:hypothetical protein
MVQVDVFWGYGWGASLAVACGHQLAHKAKPLETAFWAKTCLFLALFWAPTGLLLLMRHPSWETMQAAASFADLSVWLVLAFGITNITQGLLGFWVGQHLIRTGKLYAAQLNWIFGYFGMFFILLYGWDGLGYDRFLYDRDLFAGSTAWTPGAGTVDGIGAALQRFVLTFSNLSGGATVISTLLTDGLWLVPPFFVLFSSWLKQDAISIGQPAPGNLQILASYLAGVFVLGLGCAALCALSVGLCAQLLGVGEVIWHGSFYAPEQLNRHVLSYLLGLPLSLGLIWLVLLRPGMPLALLIAPLMLGQRPIIQPWSTQAVQA